MGLQRLALLEGEVVGAREVYGGIGDGERAGLVDDHGIHFPDPLEGGGVFDEDVVACGLTDAHHQ